MTSDGTRTFEWDARNQLVGVTIGGHRSEFVYDGQRRRVREAEWEGGTLQSEASVVWCQGKMCEERASDGLSVLRRSFPLGEQLAGISHFFAADHLGSVTDVVNVAGMTLARYAYYPWGDRTLMSGADITASGFTRHRRHPATGTWLTHHRVLDPQLARWVSDDPAGRRDGLNLSAYVMNNPVRYTDPSGLTTWKCSVNLATYGSFPGGVAIQATCTSDCVGGRRLTQSLIGAGTGGSAGLPMSYSYAEYTLRDNLGGPTTFSLPGLWLYSGLGLAGGVIGGSYASLTLGAATSGVWALDWEAGFDGGADAFSGFTVPTSSTWSRCCP